MRLWLLLILCFVASDHLWASTLKDSLANALAESRGKFSSYKIFDCCRMTSSSRAFAIIAPSGNSVRGERIAQFSFTDGNWRLDWIDKDRHQQPWKVMCGDANSDGTEDLAVCVFKKPKHWPDSTNGFFVYKLTEKSIAPLWLGSRLSLPFIDAELVFDEKRKKTLLLAIERHSKGFRAVQYEWKSFGFFVTKILTDDTQAKSIKEFLETDSEKL